jgi:hypothetical protein
MKIPVQKIPKAGQVGLLLSGAAVYLLASRYMGTRKVSAAERLAEALLDTDPLEKAARSLPDTPETALAECVAYLVGVAYQAAEGLGKASGPDDPVGATHSQTHSYSGATSLVLTEASRPESIHTYTVNVPDVAQVRGTRRIQSIRLAGLNPVRPTPEAVQITLKADYTAQLESSLEATDYLVTGKNRIHGGVTMRDNRGNFGLLTIEHNGSMIGTITRGERIVGRFTGQVESGVKFQPYQSLPGES